MARARALDGTEGAGAARGLLDRSQVVPAGAPPGEEAREGSARSGGVPDVRDAGDSPAWRLPRGRGDRGPGARAWVGTPALWTGGDDAHGGAGAGLACGPAPGEAFASASLSRQRGESAPGLSGGLSGVCGGVSGGVGALAGGMPRGGVSAVLVPAELSSRSACGRRCGVERCGCSEGTTRAGPRPPSRSDRSSSDLRELWSRLLWPAGRGDARTRPELDLVGLSDPRIT